MQVKRCDISENTLGINVILGPFKVFDPGRYLQSLTLDDRYSLSDLFRLSKYDEVKEFLDSTVELGKDRAKKYFLFVCKKSALPKLKKGGDYRDMQKGEIMKNISKTAIIRYSERVILGCKTDTVIRCSGIQGPAAKDKYDLCKYFEKSWVSTVLSGEAKLLKSSYDYVNKKLFLFICLYISRKQGWI
jgi:hypothetical protein